MADILNIITSRNKKHEAVALTSTEVPLVQDLIFDKDEQCLTWFGNGTTHTLDIREYLGNYQIDDATYENGILTLIDKAGEEYVLNLAKLAEVVSSDSSTVSLKGTGSSDSPLIASVVIDKDSEGNLLKETEDGLVAELEVPVVSSAVIKDKELTIEVRGTDGTLTKTKYDLSTTNIIIEEDLEATTSEDDSLPTTMLGGRSLLLGATDLVKMTITLADGTTKEIVVPDYSKYVEADEAEPVIPPEEK